MKAKQYYYTYFIHDYLFYIAEEDECISKITLNGDMSDYLFYESELILKAKKELEEYFEKKRTKFDLSIKFGGTDFQNHVWQVMKDIPYGSVISYGELANLCGCPNGSRAIGNVCHNNPILILIPCHRVVAKNSLGGFGGGTLMKEKLLELENAKVL